MESDKFDNMVRGAVNGASRRGVVRVGIGALAASALTTMGLRAEDADAKKKKKKKKKKPKPITCAGTTPVTCGTGCCPGTFSKCCLADISDNPPGTQTCNPTAFNCCSADLGGGSCPGGNTCCPPSRTSSFGSCADNTEKCCTVEQGGGTCDSDETCCPPNAANASDSGSCCNAGQACCITGGAACPAGQVCNGGPNESGCCVPAPPRMAPGANRRRNGGERFHMLAQ